MADNDDLEPKDHALKSLGFLWKAAREATKAAREAATGIRKEVKRGSIGKAVDQAGREVARAAKNVGSRLGMIENKADDASVEDDDTPKKS